MFVFFFHNDENGGSSAAYKSIEDFIDLLKNQSEREDLLSILCEVNSSIEDIPTVDEWEALRADMIERMSL